jgi:alanyl-tRNA synthetase
VVGTRRIEAVAGLSCIQWYRKAYEPVPEALKLLRANGTNEMIDKLEKTLQQAKDLQKRVDFMNEKLASAGEVIVHPISGRIKGKYCSEKGNTDILTMKVLDVDVKIHLIDSDLDASFMQKRANVLKESQPKSAHILVNGNTLVVALNGREIKTETANSVRYYIVTNNVRYLQVFI